MTVQVHGDRRRRAHWGVVAAVGLAVIAVVLLVLGLLTRPATPPTPSGQAAAPLASTTSATSTREQPSPGAPRALTTGPLMDSSTPVELTIPALAVSSRLVDLGLQDNSAMEVPVNGEDTGWYTGAPTPGALGPAVIAGHVDWEGRPGVFQRLNALRPGDQIEVRREDDSTATFAVTSVRQYPKDAFPTDEVYGTIDHAGLRLITCGGEFDSSRSSYRDNFVAYAKLVNARP